MPFLTFDQAEAMNVQQIAAFLCKHCRNDASRREMWTEVIHPYFEARPTNRQAYAATVTGNDNQARGIYEPYGSNPSVPIPDIANAIGYVLSVSGQDARLASPNDEEFSGSFEDWAATLVAIYAVFLLILFPLAGDEGVIAGACPTVVHVLWTDSANVRLSVDGPEVRPGEGMYQALGSTLAGVGQVKNSVRAMRRQALLDTLKKAQFLGAEMWVLNYEAHGREPPMGSCAEVLPFLSVMMTVVPGNENHRVVYGFALDVPRIARRTTRGMRSVGDLHRHSFKEACQKCSGLMREVGVRYIQKTVTGVFPS